MYNVKGISNFDNMRRWYYIPEHASMHVLYFPAWQPFFMGIRPSAHSQKPLSPSSIVTLQALSFMYSLSSRRAVPWRTCEEQLLVRRHLQSWNPSEIHVHKIKLKYRKNSLISRNILENILENIKFTWAPMILAKLSNGTLRIVDTGS